MAASNSLLVSVPKAAELLGVSPITVWRLLRDKKISHHRIGDRVLFSPKDLEAFLESTKVPAASNPKEA